MAGTPTDDNKRPDTEVDTSNIEDRVGAVTVDVESVYVDGDRINHRVIANLSLKPEEARRVVCGERNAPGDSEYSDSEDAGTEDTGMGLLSGPGSEYRDADDREFPVTADDVDTDNFDASDMWVNDAASDIHADDDTEITTVYGRVVSAEHIEAPGFRRITLAGTDGTVTVQVYDDLDEPDVRQGDQIVVTNVKQDTSPSWRSTFQTRVIVLCNSMYPEGYWLEERSALAAAEEWYNDDENEDWEAEELVKNTILDECHIETPRGQDDVMMMYIDAPGSDLHGTWTQNGEDRIKELLEEHLPEWKTNDRTKNSVVSSLRDRTRVPDDAWDEGTPDDEALQWSVGVQNGIIDLRTGELHDHGPEWQIRRKLPVEYNPEQYDGLGDGLDWFIGETMKTDGDRDSFKFMLGHALARCYPAETVWALIGPGGNGKTLLLEVIQQLLGDVSGAFDLDIMTGDSDFGGGPLIGSNLVIDDDATDVKMQKTGLMKKASGGSEALVNQKYDQMTGDGYNNYATMVYLANDPPMFSDKTRGMERRIFPVLMPHEFTNDPTDDKKDKIPRREIRNRTQTAEELEALLVVAVQYAQRLFRGDDVKDGRTEEERWTTYEKYSDNILRFWKECTTSEKDARVTRNAVYEIYVQWCDHRGVDPKNTGGRNGFWPLSDQCHGVSYNRDSVYLDGERAIEHVTLDPGALAYAPAWVADKWEADIDEKATTLANRLDRPTPLADLDGGYCTTEARVIARGYADEHEETGVQLTLEDDTTAIDAITWDDKFDGVHVGDKVRLDRAKLSQYRSVPQLKTAGATEVKVVEPGPNHRSRGESEPDSDPSPTAVTGFGDDGEQSQQEHVEALKEVVDEVADGHDAGAPLDEIRAAAEERGISEDKFQHEFDRLRQSGEVYEPATGRWRCT